MVGPWFSSILDLAFFGPLGGVVSYAAKSLFRATKKVPMDTIRARNNFIASLLALTAAIMKVDGRATKSELAIVKQFFLRKFGPEIARQVLQMLRRLLNQDIPVGPVCVQIRANMNYSQRLALLHYLYSLAHADGVLHPAEDRLLGQFAREFGIQAADIRSIAAMFAPQADPDADYRVLEIPRSATDDEVRKAYRRMSMKHHPDKVAHLGAEFQKAATEKFQRVNAAYAAIKQARDMT